MENKAVICTVGDLMLCDSPLYVSVGAGATYSKIKGRIFGDCAGDFQSADIVIGNLESVLYEPRHRNLLELQMSSSMEMIEEIRDAGFNMLNIANNHCLQHGTVSFLNTKSMCSKLGMRCTGIKDEPTCQIEVNGILFAFLSLCLYTEFYHPEDIQYEGSIARVVRKVEALKKKNSRQVVVLSVHWGDEFATYPSSTQIELAHLFVDHGVDIVLGHHSHVYQGIENYKDSLILYSQGNFVSDMLPQMCKRTAVAKITVNIEGDTKSIIYEVLPYYINDDFIPERTEDGWFAGRQEELKRAINNEISNEKYMQMVNANHKVCHNIFRDRFVKGFFDYKLNISGEMIYLFLVRKMKKKLGIWPKRFDLDGALLSAKEDLVLHFD